MQTHFTKICMNGTLPLAYFPISGDVLDRVHHGAEPILIPEFRCWANLSQPEPVGIRRNTNNTWDCCSTRCGKGHRNAGIAILAQMRSSGYLCSPPPPPMTGGGAGKATEGELVLATSKFPELRNCAGNNQKLWQTYSIINYLAKHDC